MELNEMKPDMKIDHDARSAAFFGHEKTIAQVYGQGRREQVGRLTRLYPQVVSPQDLGAELSRLDEAGVLRELEVIFSTWGMPVFSIRDLDRMPALRAVFYAAGGVQHFARPMLERDITVVSAWQANAVPVAEWTLAQILLANKGYHRNMQQCLSPTAWREGFRGAGNFGETIALLGAGAIGRRVIELLRPFTLKIVVFDPFLSNDNATALGVEKVSLDEAFKRAIVVSNHLANNPQTQKMLREEHFARMRPGATFINTGRGQTVDQPALVRVLDARPDLTALLDVTDPEPPEADSPLYTLPNAHLTSHIAGSIGMEVVRMADYVIEEFQAWDAGKPLRYAVSLAQLETMA
jgi:phosphoglycerate dehydrogenase-like enzyme